MMKKTRNYFILFLCISSLILSSDISSIRAAEDNNEDIFTISLQNSITVDVTEEISITLEEGTELNVVASSVSEEGGLIMYNDVQIPIDRDSFNVIAENRTSDYVTINEENKQLKRINNEQEIPLFDLQNEEVGFITSDIPEIEINIYLQNDSEAIVIGHRYFYLDEQEIINSSEEVEEVAEAEEEITEEEKVEKDIDSETNDSSNETNSTIATLQFDQTKYFSTNQEQVPLYQNYNNQLKTVAYLKQNQVYEYYQDVGNWLRVMIGGEIFYVWKDAIKPSAGNIANKIDQLALHSLTTKMSATIYDNSTGSLIPIGTINENLLIDYISKSGSWYKVSYLNRTGYIYESAVIETDKGKLDYFYVNKDNLIVNKPGKIAFAKLEKGEIYEIAGSNPNWYKMKIGQEIGYVWKDAVDATSEKPPKETLNVGNGKLFTLENVPVYDNSTGKLVKIGEILEDQKVNYIHKQGNWYQILFGNRIGYIYHTGVEIEFTNNIEYFKVNQSNVAIMARKNGELETIGVLKEGEIYQRVADYGNWHQIKIGNQYAFIWKKATSPMLNRSFSNPVGNNDSQELFKTTTTVDVYDNSSGSLHSMGTIGKNNAISVISVTGNWLKVDYSGRLGYIYKSTLTRVAKDLVNSATVYTYDQMVKDLTSLQNLYPGHVKTKIIGKSVDQRNIYAVKLGTGKKEIFLNSSHHAREHMTTNVLMEMLDQYALAYATNQTYEGYQIKDILDDTSIWFVPMVNPDGVTLVQKGYQTAKNPSEVLRLNNYSKDFSSWKANIRGVDLNRQYPADWANIRNTAISPGYMNYKGLAPLTEPEVKAIYEFTNQHQFKTTVAYHSSGEIIYWHYKNPSSTYWRDQQIAKNVGNITGYTLISPSINPSGGGYKDWFILDKKMPSLTIEISPYTNQKPVPMKYWNSIWQENKTVGIYLAKEASNR